MRSWKNQTPPDTEKELTPESAAAGFGLPIEWPNTSLNVKSVLGIGLIAFSALLAGCGNHSSSANSLTDDQIRQKMVGTWKLDDAPTNSLTFKLDGSVSSTVDGGHGTWTVTNGVLITIESGPDGDTETDKVVQIDDRKCVLQEAGVGDVTKLSKQ